MDEEENKWIESYKTDVENYLTLVQDHEVRLEFIDGIISTKAGAPVILLGKVSPYPNHRAPFLLLAGLSQDEIAEVAEFVKQLEGKREA